MEEPLLDQPLPSQLTAKFGNPLPMLARTFFSILIIVITLLGNLSLPYLIIGVFLMYLIVFMRSGRIIDLEHLRTKKYISPLPFKLGTWKAIEKPTQIMVSMGNSRSGGMYSMMTYSSTDVYYDVDLVQPNETFLTAGRFDNFPKAETLGHQLADHFDVELNDITERDL